MQLIKWLFALSAAMLLSSCQTTSSFHASNKDVTRINENTAQIIFPGYRSMYRGIVSNDLLSRCAEVTLQFSYDHFTITSLHAAPTYKTIVGPQILTEMMGYGYGNAHPYSTYLPGKVSTQRQFETTVIIQMFRGQPPYTASTKVYDARAVLGR